MKYFIFFAVTLFFSYQNLHSQNKIITKKFNTFAFALPNDEYETEMSIKVNVIIYREYKTFTYETSNFFGSLGTFIFTNGTILDKYKNSDNKNIIKARYISAESNEFVNIYYIENLSSIQIEYEKGKYNRIYNK